MPHDVVSQLQDALGASVSVEAAAREATREDRS